MAVQIVHVIEVRSNHGSAHGSAVVRRCELRPVRCIAAGESAFQPRRAADPVGQLLLLPRSRREPPRGRPAARCARGGVDSAAIVPGKPAESTLVERILADDPDERMPPPDSHKTLTNRQKEILQRWIAQGAEYQRHWAYEPPVKADVPAGQNGVDVLVARRLAEIGLQPSPEADRRTLIRRLSWDLIGLPPTPEEVAAFENDSSPKAYEKLVDRLLQNPHYGERMAITWLDVVRFADTIGYHSDNPRNVWPYRDWVIQSFQRQQAVRSVHDRADCRRPAAGRQPADARRLGLQPAAADDRGGRCPAQGL